jgi:anti-anti-sigma factor
LAEQGEQGMVRAHEWDVSRRLARAPGGHRPWWVTHPAPVRHELRLHWESAGAHAVVAVSGDVDDLTAAQLEESVDERSPAGCAVLEVDLADVRSMGTAGLAVLQAVQRSCRQRDIEFRVRGAQPSVWRVFETAGLDRAFAPGAGAAGHSPTQELSLF